MTVRSFLLAGIISWSWLVGDARVNAETPVVNGEPLLQPDGTIRFRIQGEFRPSLESARESARQTAQERMRDWLGKQNPPIRRVPSLDNIRRMVRQEYSPQQEMLNQKDTMYKITMDVDLHPKNVRDLRERDRVLTGIWTLGGLLALLGIAALLFRIDEWTKGYLTRWLIAAGVGAVIALLAGWWFVR